MKKLIVICTILSTPLSALASDHFVDYSGIYACTGNDHRDGKYTGTLTLTLDHNQSTGQYGAYAIKMEVPGYAMYLGQATSYKNSIAIGFASTEPTSKDFGIGIATVEKTPAGKLTFRKYYYEPDYKEGNYGFEECVKR